MNALATLLAALCLLAGSGLAMAAQGGPGDALPMNDNGERAYAPYPDDSRAGPPPVIRSYSQGQVLPPHYRVNRLENYAVFRLRTPPPGYVYFKVGKTIYLISEDTGVIFEVMS